MPRTLPRLAALVGGLLMTRRARGPAGRGAVKLTLAALAWELLRNRKPHTARTSAPHPRRRWSGRRL